MPLLRIVRAELRAHFKRFLLTVAAIAGGAGFVAGTFVYADTARAAFYDELARSARGVDAVMLPIDGDVLSRIPENVVQQVRAEPGVSDVDGRTDELVGLLDKNGRLISNCGRSGHALSLPKSPALQRFSTTQGRLPERSGEVAVDHLTVDRFGFAVGERVQLVTDGGRTHEMTLVGVIDLGVHRQHRGLSVVTLSDQDFRDLLAPKGVSELVARGDRAADALRAHMPEGFRVMTGDQWREELAVEAAKYVDGFHQIILAFSLISLAVAVFVIYNTFTILTARRSRELALWRCQGASRTQIRLLVLLEAVALGLAGSLAGLLVSAAIGWGLVTGRSLFGTAIPDHALVVNPLPILITLVTGVATAVIAALLPAWRAGRVSPLAALQQGETQALSLKWVRLFAAAGLGGLGALMMRHGVPGAFDGLPWVFGGASVLFGGLILLGPLVIGWITAVVGWLPTKLAGPPALLAVRQARHNPRRAATTTSALLVATGVLATVSVLLATAADQSRRELTENFAADFQLSSVDVKMGNGAARVPQALITGLRGRGEFAEVTGVRTELALVENSGMYVWAAQELKGTLTPEIVQGSLEDLGPQTAAIARDVAEYKQLNVGQVLEVDDLKYKVIAIYDDAPSSADVLLSWDGFAALKQPQEPDTVLIALAGGVTVARGQSVLTEVLTAYPLIQISGEAQTRAELTESFDKLLTIFTALLGVSLLIALFGIGNTLALSVWERRGESATLRALGLSRRGLAAMLLWEAVLMALIGGGIGLFAGAIVGWTASLSVIKVYGHGSPVIPFGQFAVYLLVAVVAGAIAALVPARRMSRH